jgi:ABC-type multidrug transport system fused ATPase/permease subunit
VKEISHESEVWLSIMIGIFRFLIFGFYVYSFWIATKFIEEKYNNPNSDNEYSVNDLLCILMAILTGMVNLMGLNPNFEALIKARVAGRMIFDVLDREPMIKDLPNCIENFTLDRAIRF